MRSYTGGQSDVKVLENRLTVENTGMYKSSTPPLTAILIEM